MKKENLMSVVVAICFIAFILLFGVFQLVLGVAALKFAMKFWPILLLVLGVGVVLILYLGANEKNNK